MHVLFVHQNFPAQFRYMAPRLASDYGWQCTFVTQQTQGTLAAVEKILYKPRGGATLANHLCTRTFENCVAHAHGVYETLKANPRIKPDLIVAHSGFGSSVFLPHLYDAPIINFFEFFYRPTGQDLGYRPELPVTEAALLRTATRNAMMLLDLETCTRGWTATHYQREYLPAEFRQKVDVIFDGVDTAVYHRKDNPRRRIGPESFIDDPNVRIVTYVARGFEMMRGFDIFIKAAKRIYEQYPNVIFVVVGTDKVSYGSDLEYVKAPSFREHVLASADLDLSKFRFTGYVPQEILADILSISDLHIYLTQPFIASWSMVDAMACGAVVLASDQACVREYIRPGENGLLCDFFDVEGLARRAVEVLKDPAAYRQIGEAARRTVEERYSLSLTMPRLKEFFEKTAGQMRRPSVRAELLVREGTMRRLLTRQDDAETEGAANENEADAGAMAPTPSSAQGLVPTGTLAPLDGAIVKLREICSQGRRTADWVQVAQNFRGPTTAFSRLGPMNHPGDLARLLTRVVEFKPRLIVDLSGSEGGSILLWSRAALDDATIIAAGLPDRPLDSAKLPFFAAMAKRGQAIHCIPRPKSRDAMIDEVEKLCKGGKIDFLFMTGRRPHADLRADLRHFRNRVRKAGLIAWDFVRPLIVPDASCDGGTRLWAECKPMYPFHAEYLAGTSSEVGGIVAIKL